MHLQTILVFAFLFWRKEPDAAYRLWGEEHVYLTLLVAALLPTLIWLISWLTARTALRRLRRGFGGGAAAAHHVHVRDTMMIRVALVVVYAGLIFLTPLYDIVTIGPRWALTGADLLVFLPYLLSILGLWAANYPLDRELRRLSFQFAGTQKTWRFWAYLDFNLRHHILVVAVPMLLILLAYNLTGAYHGWLAKRSGVFWLPEGILGTTAVGVFLLAPWMLRYIWHTHPLEPGPVRDRLERLCERIGMRCHDILVWRSDGMMINAAVMGIFAPLRFVMLSDGLLQHMTPAQVEGVFGHEAGHIKHRHIQFFLVFAFVGWLISVSVMELVSHLVQAMPADSQWPDIYVQGSGMLVMIAFWGVGFGWLSQRFERQADSYGAACVTPDSPELCQRPCSVHGEEVAPGSAGGTKDRMCATGAEIFASALNRVAVLNGIPHEEYSWRHSSIANRMRFLAAQAGDPGVARSFARLLKRIKGTLLLLAVIGAVLSTAYVYWFDVAILTTKA